MSASRTDILARSAIFDSTLVKMVESKNSRPMKLSKEPYLIDLGYLTDGHNANS